MSDITVHPKQDQLLPPDPHLVLPPAVRKQIAAADAAHKQVFGDAVDPNKPLPLGAVKIEPEPAKPEPQPEPAKVAQADPQPDPAPKETPASVAQPEPPPAEITADKWEHYTKSMQGRYKQQDTTIATLQDQLMQMGDEVQRLTSALTTRPVYGQPGQPAPLDESPKLITDKDVDTYGAELIDVARRAALEATAPELTRLEKENQELQKRLQKQASQDVYNSLDQQVENWREINRSPRFKLWLRLRDIYSREVRGKLLNDAFQAADAARVVEFFRGFIRDEVAAGQIEAQPASTSQPAAKPAPTRTPAMALDTLAAPGRAASATDTLPSQQGKPVYTHAEIKRFYNDVRRGAYAGRDAVKAQIEADMFAAQREGRVRG